MQRAELGGEGPTLRILRVVEDRRRRGRRVVVIVTRQPQLRRAARRAHGLASASVSGIDWREVAAADEDSLREAILTGSRLSGRRYERKASILVSHRLRSSTWNPKHSSSICM